MINHNLSLVIDKIPIEYFISASAFIFLLLAFAYYWYLNVQECRRSRERESAPLLGQISEEQSQVYQQGV